MRTPRDHKGRPYIILRRIAWASPRLPRLQRCPGTGIDWKICVPSATPWSCHDTTACRLPRRRLRRRKKQRGVGERWPKPFDGYPADDRLRSPHPVPRTVPTCVGGPGGSSLSLADALGHRPGVASGGCVAILRLANLHLKSPG